MLEAVEAGFVEQLRHCPDVARFARLDLAQLRALIGGRVLAGEEGRAFAIGDAGGRRDDKGECRQNGARG